MAKSSGGGTSGTGGRGGVTEAAGVTALNALPSLSRNVLGDDSVPIPDGMTVNRDVALGVAQGVRVAALNAAPVRTIAISKLIATQNGVRRATVEHFVRNPDSQSHGGGSKGVYVVKKGGQYYIQDGHHRIVGRMLRGRTTVRAHVLEID